MDCQVLKNVFNTRDLASRVRAKLRQSWLQKHGSNHARSILAHSALEIHSEYDARLRNTRERDYVAVSLLRKSQCKGLYGVL